MIRCEWLILLLLDFDWLRKLSIRMWYVEKPSENIQEVWKRFCEKEVRSSPDICTKRVRTESLVSKESNSYSLNHNKLIPLVYDIFFILLEIFCETRPLDFVPHKVLNAYTKSEDVLDVKHIWIINEFLVRNHLSNTEMQLESEEVKNMTEERDFRYRLVRAFAYQLELLGLWEYAVFVVLIADESKPSNNI